MANDTTIFDVELVEKELINIDLSVRELVDIELSVIDIVPIRKNVSEMDDVNISNPQDDEILVREGKYWVNKSTSVLIDTYAVHNETPTNVSPLPSERFRTTFAFRTETLQVFLNGMKIHSSEITQHSDTEFSFSINIITSDKVEVAYIKK